MLNRTVPATAEGMPASAPTPAALDTKLGPVSSRSLADQANAKQLGTSALTSGDLAAQIERQSAWSAFDCPASPAPAEPELDGLRAVVSRLNDDERAAIHALALALASDTNADRVAAMTPHIGREKAEAAHKLALEMDR